MSLKTKAIVKDIETNQYHKLFKFDNLFMSWIKQYYSCSEYYAKKVMSNLLKQQTV